MLLEFVLERAQRQNLGDHHTRVSCLQLEVLSEVLVLTTAPRMRHVHTLLWLPARVPRAPATGNPTVQIQCAAWYHAPHHPRSAVPQELG